MLVLCRTVLAALLLLPLAARRGELAPLRSRLLPLAAFAGVEIATPWIALGTAEQRLSSSLTGLLVAAVPLVGVVIAATTGTRERPGRQNLAGAPDRNRGRGSDRRPRCEGRVRDRARRARAGRRLLRGGARDPAALAHRPTLARRDRCLARARRARLRADRRVQLPDAGATRERGRVDRRACSCLHCARVRSLLPADRGGRPGARDGDHVRQPRRGGRARSDSAERAVHGRDGNWLRARARRLCAGHGREGTPSRRAGRGERARDRVCGRDRWLLC
jgi:hypothetical protein